MIKQILYNCEADCTVLNRKPQVISGVGGVRTPCTLPLDPPLLKKYRTAKPQDERKIEIIHSTDFRAAQRQVIFHSKNKNQRVERALNSADNWRKTTHRDGSDFAISRFHINGNKGIKCERNKPDAFFLERFSATFKSEHHCQCCIVRCYLFVCVHHSYG